jgi:Tfp pilus assembly protein PilW
MLTRAAVPRHRQGGLSLVELMVGIAVGLFVLAAAAAMTATQLTDNRRLLLETQVQQDLRMTADIIARDLRRSGYAGSQWVRGIWPPTGGALSTSLSNPFSGFSPAQDEDTVVQFQYWDSDAGATRNAGYRLQGTRVQSLLGATWQDLTDTATLTITEFTVDTQPVAVSSGPLAGKLPCPRMCSDGTTDCWPSVDVRDISVTIAGEAASDSRVQHRFTRVVRLRNDLVNFEPGAGGSACPT